jgi:ABC-type phosphate transport system substrate-binding protein
MPALTRSIRSRVARPRAVAAPLFAVLALVAASATTAVIASSAGAATRTLTVTPATGLINQAVQVSWTGFNPTTDTGLNQVIILQCKAHPTSLADCYTQAPFPSSANGNEIVNGVTHADHTGTARFEIRPTAQLPDLGCDQSHPCSVLAYENQVVAPGKLPSLSATAPITFAHSQADCPDPTNLDVRTEGEASGNPLLYNWAAQRCTGANPMVIDFTESSSERGRINFLQRLVDVGITSLAATPDELKAAPGHPAFAYSPIDLTGVGVVYNLNDPITQQPITDLTLSPRLLARLITDTDLSTFFADPELLKLNPHHQWPINGASTPLIRAEANADTWITTNWIASNTGAENFLEGKDAFHVPVYSPFQNTKYPIDIFENTALDDAYLPRQGQYKVVTNVFYGARPADTSPLDPGDTGFIGVVDLPAAHRFNLPVAKLVNASGKAVAPDTAGILAGYHAMVAGADGTLVANPASTDPAAYPLVKVDYAMVPKQTDAAHQKHIRDFLTWGASEGQKGLPQGYVPLPSALATRADSVAAGISVTAAPATTTPTTVHRSTTSTTPTTLPASVGSDASGSCCSSGGSFVGGSSGGGALVPVTTPATPVKSHPATTKTTVGTASGSTPVGETTVASTKPPSRIAAAGAPLALPVLLLGGVFAALVVALRNVWPRLPRRALAGMLKVAPRRGTASSTT